jgi:hypothetical protein
MAAIMAAIMGALLQNGWESSAGASCAVLEPTAVAPILWCDSSGASLDALLSTWLAVCLHSSSLAPILRTTEDGNESSRADVAGGGLRRVLQSLWAASSAEYRSLRGRSILPRVSSGGPCTLLARAGF